jgi:hypothetical protein
MSDLSIFDMTSTSSAINSSRTILEKFERSKLLEVYFARIDGRRLDEQDSDIQELYELELEDIKAFLLGQHPRDTLLHKFFRIMS